MKIERYYVGKPPPGEDIGFASSSLEGQALARDAVALVDELFHNHRLSLPYQVDMPPWRDNLDTMIVANGLKVPIVFLGDTGTRWEDVELDGSALKPSINVRSRWWPAGIPHQTQIGIDAEKPQLINGCIVGGISVKHDYLNDTAGWKSVSGRVVAVDMKGQPISDIRRSEIAYAVIFTGFQGFLPGIKSLLSGVIVYKELLEQ